MFLLWIGLGFLLASAIFTFFPDLGLKISEQLKEWRAAWRARKNNG